VESVFEKMIERVAEQYQNFIEFRAWTRDILAILGGFIALKNYLSQQRQRAIDNSKKLIAEFKNTIGEDDLNQWEQVLLNSYESAGAEPGCFIVFTSDDRSVQISLKNLFIPEGKGLYLENIKMNLTISQSDLNFGSIRRITEQLNLISYEVLYGRIELNIQ
jgi:hypothetical protein